LQAKQTLSEAQINLKRDRQLADQGYLPAQNVDEQVVVVGNDAQALRSAQASLRSAIVNQVQNGTPQRGLQASTITESEDTAAAQYATADQLRRQISRATIVSPIDGVVINRNLNPGEYPSGRQIFTLEGNDSVFAILTASAVQAYQIRAGDRALVERAGMAGRRFAGHVAAVLDAATPGSTNFTIKVSVPNPEHELRAGTPVRAIVDLGGFSGAAVPASAFVNDTRTRVMTVVDGRAHPIPVVERATDGETSIVSGLAPGTRVIRDGGADIDDGASVRPVR
jgi:RND family efflux transporter MFP subunit